MASPRSGGQVPHVPSMRPVRPRRGGARRRGRRRAGSCRALGTRSGSAPPRVGLAERDRAVARGAIRPGYDRRRVCDRVDRRPRRHGRRLPRAPAGLDRVVALKVLAPEFADDRRSGRASSASPGSPPRSSTPTSSPSTPPARPTAIAVHRDALRRRATCGLVAESGRRSPRRAAAIVDQVGAGARRRPRARPRASRRQAGEHPARRPADASTST